MKIYKWIELCIENILARWQRSKAKESEAMEIGGARERKYCKSFFTHTPNKQGRENCTIVNLDSKFEKTGTVINLLPERIASNSVCRPEDHIHALLRLRYRMIGRRVCSVGLCSHAGGTFRPSHWFWYG